MASEKTGTPDTINTTTPCPPGAPVAGMGGTTDSVESTAGANGGGETPAAKTPAIDLNDPSLFLNREISWIRFNQRIFAEAGDTGHPLLERIKFLAICGSNLDEFFMIRVSGLRRQLVRGALKAPPDGMTPAEQLAAIRAELLPLLQQYAELWQQDIVPALAAAGICLTTIAALAEDRRLVLRQFFEEQIFPTITPLAMDPAHPFPFISNLCHNLAVVLRDEQGKEMYARIKVPTNLFPRLIQVPDDDAWAAATSRPGTEFGGTATSHPQRSYVFLEDLMAANLDLLFPGLEVVCAHPFRVTRDAEIEISLDQASDLLTAVEESIESRRIGKPIRLEVDAAMPASLVSLFTSYLGMNADMVYPFAGPLGLVDLWQLRDIDRPDLKDEPFLAFTPSPLGEDRDMFAAIRRQDYVLYHPYDSFNVTINFLRQAATDPDVLAIKITLYRIDQKSPIIDALLTAKQNGKAVATLVELKAKFDEENNIIWARALEEAGVHVVYGLIDLKVHCKVLLVVRREGKGITHYCHLSSGNYNAVTARVYGDIACFTADPEIGADVSRLFNALTGYAQNVSYRHLLVAPMHLRREIIARIDREIAQHEKHHNGYLAFKLNGLLDKYVIQALYRASKAGVCIDLNVRGLCGLRPGVPGISDNITVTSIVGRFLEHARIYYFRNGGDEEVLLGSADMMPRNLINRVEILFPVRDGRRRRAIIDHMLRVHLADTVKARRLRPDGTYEPVQPEAGQEPLDSQRWLIEHRGVWHALDEPVEIEYV